MTTIGSQAALRGETRRSPPIRRLRAYDVHCLAVETAARPIHIGILATVEPGPLLDADGRLRLAEIRGWLGAATLGVPELRRVVHRAGPLAGRPVWVDDPAFRIEHHVGAIEVAAPGEERELHALVERLLAGVLDRSRPLWRMWFVTGLAGGRMAVLVVLHHALADGQAAMRMVRALLGPPIGSQPSHALPAAIPAPGWPALVADNARAVARAVAALARPATWRLARDVARAVGAVMTVSRESPGTSLNGPVGPGRRLAVVALDLAAARRVARASGCGVNDVVLSLVAGGVRELLAGRGEPVETLRPRAGVAVARFSATHEREAGNDIGTLHVALPLAEPDPRARLPLIAASRAAAKQSPMVEIEPALRAWMRRIPGYRRTLERQRLVNLASTYLPGPQAPIDVLGARVTDLLPIAPLTGNLGLSFVALSYAGRLCVAVRADADQFPDLDVLTAAMDRDWASLAASDQGDPAATRRCRRGGR